MLMLAVACNSKSDAPPVDSSSPVASVPAATPTPAVATVDTTKPGKTTATKTASPPASTPLAPKAAPTIDAHPEDHGVVVAPTLANVDTTITIRANGPELMFDPGTITLKQGTRVKLRFTNMGSFAHNFVLVRDENDLDQIIERAHDASENIPLSLKSKMITYSNIAQPSSTVETAFVVPAPGDYTYVCLVEGHANTMVGRLRSTP